MNSRYSVHTLSLLSASLLALCACQGETNIPVSANTFQDAADDVTQSSDASTNDATLDVADAWDVVDASATVDQGSPPEVANYYVNVDGDDGNSGAIDAPFATLEAADQVVSPGDLVYIREGTYRETPRLNTSGQEGATIRYEAYPGELVIYQGPGREVFANTDQIIISGDWIELRGVQVHESVRAGVRVFGDNIWLDDLTIRDGGWSGVGFYEANDGRLTNSLLMNNYNKFKNTGELADGGDADGVSLHTCKNIVLSHNIAWHNSDDGFDLWASTDSVIENSYSVGNGINYWAADGFNGNGDGFKLGSCDSQRNESRRNLSFHNRLRGVNSNCANNSRNVHSTSFEDGYGFQAYGEDNVYNNNVAFASKNAAVSRMDDSPRQNSWDLGLNLTESDFLSVTPPTLDGTESAAEALARFDGSGFMRPSASSLLIDRGAELGGSFEGAAPDLGAFEAR